MSQIHNPHNAYETDLNWAAPGAAAEAPAALRPIAKLDYPTPLTLQPIPTEKPEYAWLRPDEILVNEAYQRELSDNSRARIRRIAENFDWRKFKAPVVALTDRGWECLDGQHTALAAILRPDIDLIPVQVIVASTQDERAAAFVGHNTGSLPVTALQLHRARVVAKDPDAERIEIACASAGIKLVYNIGGHRVYTRGDSMAVGEIDQLIRRRGLDQAVEVLKVVVAADVAPISANEIKACEFLFHDPVYASRLDPLPAGGATLVPVIRRLGKDMLHEARVMARSERLPVWKCMALIWFPKIKKRAA